MAKGTLALRQIQLGDNADTSKNFVISVPAVADGTLVIERGNGTDVLSINASGNVVMPGNVVPAFSAYQSTPQAMSANSNTKIAFQSKLFDTNSNFDTSLYRFTPTVPGYYQVTGRIGFSTACAGLAWIYKNGIAVTTGTYHSANANMCFATRLIYMNGTTDYLELNGQINTAQNLAANSAETFFEAVLVRAA